MKSLQASATTNLNLPADSYIYKILPTSAQSDPYTFQKAAQLAVICSDDSLRLFDAETLRLSPNGVLANVNKSVTSLARTNAEGNVLATCGRDGIVRYWDTRGNKKVLEIKTPNQLPLSALECHPTQPLLATGVELLENGPGESPVFLYDTRQPSTPLLSLLESHTDTITDLSFHPEHPSLLLSASTDSLINVFSVDKPAEEDAIHQIINHRSALHHAGWLDASSACVYGLGTDETFSVYALQNPDEGVEEPESEKLGDLREPLDCEYVVGMGWVGRKSCLIAGKHSESALRLVPFEMTAKPKSEMEFGFLPSNFRLDTSEMILLAGAHGEDIVRDVYIDAESQTAFSCGEDGQIKSWKLSSGNSGEKEDIKISRRDKRAKEKKQRYNPY